MEKSDVEEICLILIDSMTMAPIILIIWRNKQEKFFEFRMKISAEFRQDLGGIYSNSPDIYEDLIMDYPENNKEISLDYLLNLCKDEGSDYGASWGEELNKKVLPYIRNEKLNKLIN